MKTLVGLVQPTLGTVTFDGEDLAKADMVAIARLRKRIGFVFQNAALFDSMTIVRTLLSLCFSKIDRVSEREERDRGLICSPKWACRKKFWPSVLPN